MKNYFKIKMNTDLNLNVEMVYAIICWASDGKESHITREKICEITGIKKLDTITEYTNLLEEKGYIKKIYSFTGGKRLVTYKICQHQKDFLIVYNNVMQLRGTNLAFALKLAEFRVRGTSWIGLSNNELIKRMHISKATFYRCISTLLNENIITKVDDGYIMNIEYFPVFAEITKSDKEKIDMLLLFDDSFKGKKVMLTYYKRGFQGLRMNVGEFLDWCISGCPSINKRKGEISSQNDYASYYELMD